MFIMQALAQTLETCHFDQGRLSKALDGRGTLLPGQLARVFHGQQQGVKVHRVAHLHAGADPDTRCANGQLLQRSNQSLLFVQFIHLPAKVIKAPVMV